MLLLLLLLLMGENKTDETETGKSLNCTGEKDIQCYLILHLFEHFIEQGPTTKEKGDTKSTTKCWRVVKIVHQHRTVQKFWMEAVSRFSFHC